MSGPLYILRHGETVWNREGRMQGRADSPLTSLGRVQAARQGALLRRAGIVAPAFCSPLGRARRSAALAGLRAEVDPVLAEIDIGAGEGLPRPPDAAPGVLWKFDRPGAESQASLIARLARLRGPAILITHGVVVVAMRAVARGLPPESWDSLDDPQGVVFVLDRSGERMLG